MVASKKISVSLPSWLLNDVIGNGKNRSAKIQELIIKGYMAEQGSKKESQKDLYLFRLLKALFVRITPLQALFVIVPMKVSY